MAVPTTMRAWTFSRRGPPLSILNLSSTEPVPTIPSLRPDEVLVKVSHVALNTGVTLIMRLFPHLRNTPWIPEPDLSGTVAAVGKSILSSDLEVGDEVFGMLTLEYALMRRNGTLAEYAVCPRQTLVKRPKDVSQEQAGGLGACGITAVQAADLAKLEKGDRVLITAASGGLGHMMVQVAREHVGEEGLVVGTCSGRNRGWVKEFGCNEVGAVTARPPCVKPPLMAKL
jgi:reticulon-4-interacting protein 1, mitochondrial